MNNKALIFHFESLTVLSKPAALDHAVTMASVAETLKHYRAAAPKLLETKDAIVPESFTFANHAQQALQVATASGESQSLRRAKDLLDRRWSLGRTNERAIQQPSAPILCEGWENKRRQLESYGMQLTTRWEQSRADAESSLRQWEATIVVAERRLSTLNPASPDARKPSPPFVVSAAAGVIIGIGAAIEGQPWHIILVTALLATMVAFISMIFVHKRPRSMPTHGATLAMSRRTLMPAAEALASYYGAREATEAFSRRREQMLAELDYVMVTGSALQGVEDAAVRTVNNVGRGWFHRVDEGFVSLLGSQLAYEIVRRRADQSAEGELFRSIRAAFENHAGCSLERAACDLGEDVFLVLANAALGPLVPPVELTEAVQAVCASRDGEEAFLRIIQALSDAAASAVRLKPGVNYEIDHTLSPANVSFGLPGGPEDPLAGVIRKNFPNAPIFHGSAGSDIEIFFDQPNLATEHLALHMLSHECYERATGFERQFLWHFPRRWRAEVVRSPDITAA